MRVAVEIALGYGGMSDAGVCGVWHSWEILPGEYTLVEALALVGRPWPRPAAPAAVVSDVREVITTGGCWYDQRRLTAQVAYDPLEPTHAR